VREGRVSEDKKHMKKIQKKPKQLNLHQILCLLWHSVKKRGGLCYQFRDQMAMSHHKEYLLIIDYKHSYKL